MPPSSEKNASRSQNGAKKGSNPDRRMTLRGPKTPSEDYLGTHSHPTSRNLSRSAYRTCTCRVSNSRGCGDDPPQASSIYSPHPLRGSRACADVSSDSQVRFSDSEATGTPPLPPAPPKSIPKINLKSDPEKEAQK